MVGKPATTWSNGVVEITVFRHVKLKAVNHSAISHSDAVDLFSASGITLKV
jgi:hypothetical protein